MNRKFKILILLFSLFLSFKIFAQQISETAFEPGINQTSSPKYKGRWNDSPAPAFLSLNISHSWYNENHRVSFRKGLGLTLQYGNIDLSGGGLAASSSYSGSISSLFFNPEVMAHVKVVPQMIVELGPAFEYLIVGSAKVTRSYYTMFTTPPSSGESKISGFNRDYFNQPSYGFKVRFLNAAPNKKMTVGINLSYLWTESDASNFYAKNYFRISFLIGFRKIKSTTEELNEEKGTENSLKPAP